MWNGKLQHLEGLPEIPCTTHEIFPHQTAPGSFTQISTHSDNVSCHIQPRRSRPAMSFSPLARDLLHANHSNPSIAKPRSNRRPVTPSQARPTQRSTLNNENSANGTQQQQNPFSFPNGANTNQPNQTSQSFPPFGSGGSNSGLNTQFSAPTKSGFTFAAGPAPDQNPFTKHFPKDYSGYSGSIFNMPPPKTTSPGDNFVRDRTGQQAPQFAAHSPFHNNGNQDVTANQAQSSNESAAMAPSQQQSNQTGFSSFSQPTFASPQPTRPAPDLLERLTGAPPPPEPQVQASSNLFAQNVSSFQQSQPENQVQASSNPFGQNVAAFQWPQTQSQIQNASNSFGQGSSIFKQSQPESRAQASGNLFGQSGPTFQQSQPQSHVQASSNPFGQSGPVFQQPQPESQVPGSSNSFGQSNSGLQQSQSQSQSQPQSQGQAPVNPFANSIANFHVSPMTASPQFTPTSLPTGFSNGSSGNIQSNPANNTNGPAASGSLFDRISRPTDEPSPQAPANAPGSNTDQGVQGGLFGRITRPEPESNGQTHVSSSGVANPFSWTSAAAPIANMMASSNSTGQTWTSSAAPVANMMAPSHSAGQTVFGEGNASLFDRITKPTTESSTRADATANADNPLQTQQTSTTSNFAPFSSETSQPAKKKLFGQTLPSQITQPSFSPPGPSADSQPVKKQLFGQTLPSQTTTTTSNPKPLFSQAAPLNISQHANMEGQAGKDTQETASSKRKYDTAPEGLEEFTEAERRQLTTGYRLRHFDACMRKRLRASRSELELNLLKKYYYERVEVIRRAQGGPVEAPGKGMKRKAVEKQEIDSDQSKKSRINGPPQVAQDPVSDGVASTNSQTSSMFKNILDNKGQQPQSMPQARKAAFTPAVTQEKPASSTMPAFKVPSIPTVLPEKAPPSSMPVFKVPSIPTVLPEKAPPSSMPVFKVPSIPAVLPDKAPPSSMPAFKVPTFGAGTTPNFMAQFGKVAEKTAEEVKKKRKAEDFDSDEEDEASWERRYDEEQRAKKQKHEQVIKSNNYKEVNGKLEWTGNREDDSEDFIEPPLPPASIFDQPHKPLPKSQNIFGHLPPDRGAQEEEDDDDDDDDEDGEDEEGYEEGDDEESSSSDSGDRQRSLRKDEQGVQIATKDAAAEANHRPADAPTSRPPSPPRNSSSLSLFDRISRDDKGNPMREIPKAETKPASQASSLFSRDGGSFKNSFGSSGFALSNSFGRTDVEASKSASDKPSSTPHKNIFGQTFSPAPDQAASSKLPSSQSVPDTAKTDTSPIGDHTWKADSPINFGATSYPPSVNLTSPSASKSPLGGLFGAPKGNATADSPAKPLFSFAATTPAKAAAAATLGFNFTSAKPATNSLAPPSTTASNAASRATSPGVITGESANESNAEQDDHAPPEAQLDLAAGGPGEENEDTIYTVRAKAFKFDSEKKGWVVQGLGPLRVLKHRETGITRILLRHDPSGRVIINTRLSKDLKYDKSQPKTVGVPIVDETGKPTTWMLKIGSDDDATELANVMQENKST